MTNSKLVVFYDLDSTVCDTRQRRELAPTVNTESSWLKYSMGCGNDEPVVPVIRVLQAFRTLGYSLHAISRRHHEARSLTLDWLARYGVPYDEVRLWDSLDDPEDSAQYKYDYVKHIRDGYGYEPHLFLEDFPNIASKLSELVPVLVVNPMYSDSSMQRWQL